MNKMNMNLPCFLLSVCLLNLFSACGKSPLLNHENAITNKNPSNNREETPNPQSGSDPTSKSYTCDLKFTKSNLCASVTWISGPARGYSSFEIHFWDLKTGSGSGPFIDPNASVIVEPIMKMDMDYDPVTISKKSDGKNGTLTGVYSVTQIHFSMNGEWIIQVKLKKDNTLLEQQDFQIKI